MPVEDALAAVFEKQFDCVNEHGEACPGEVTCSETDGKPLHRYGATQDTASICGGCRFKKSKPEDVHDELRPLVTMAFELNELKTAGAVFNYPDGLRPVEWMALTALQRGKARSDATDRKRREKKR